MVNFIAKNTLRLVVLPKQTAITYQRDLFFSLLLCTKLSERLKTHEDRRRVSSTTLRFRRGLISIELVCPVRP